MAKITNELNDCQTIPRQLIFDNKRMLKQKNYTTLQGWMVSELKLSGLELICYALIYGFTQDEESVFMGSRKYLSQWLGCSLPTVDKTLKTLIDKGLIEKHTEVINNVTFNRYKHVALDDNFIPHKKTFGGSKEFLGGAKDVFHNNNNNKDNIDNRDNIENRENINNKKEKKEIDKSISKKKKKLFDFSGINGEFLPAIEKWLEYKSARGQQYKNQMSFNIMVNRLLKLSNYNAINANEIVDQSIANNYAGLFALNKTKKTGMILNQDADARNNLFKHEKGW